MFHVDLHFLHLQDVFLHSSLGPISPTTNKKTTNNISSLIV